MFSISLEHADTKMYLSSDSKYSFGNPIAGQLEVSARTYKGDTELWIAQEGIYMSSSSIVGSTMADDELWIEINWTMMRD